MTTEDRSVILRVMEDGEDPHEILYAMSFDVPPTDDAQKFNDFMTRVWLLVGLAAGERMQYQAAMKRVIDAAGVALSSSDKREWHDELEAATRDARDLLRKPS